MSAQFMTKTQNLPRFSLKCHPFHPDIHKDPSSGAVLKAAYDNVMAAMVVAGIMIVILG